MTSEQFPPVSQQQAPQSPQPHRRQPPQEQPPRRARSRSLVPIVFASAAAVVVVVGTLLVLRAVAPGCDALDAAAVEQVIGEPVEEKEPVTQEVAEKWYEPRRDAGICDYEYETPDTVTAPNTRVSVAVYPDQMTNQDFERLVSRMVDLEEGETVRPVEGLGEAALATTRPDPSSATLHVKTADSFMSVSVFNVRRDDDWALPLEVELARSVLERIA